MSLSPIVGKETFPPITMTGTPKDFADDFFTQLEQPIRQTAFTITGISELEEALKKAEEEKAKKVKSESKKEVPKKPTASKPKEEATAPVAFDGSLDGEPGDDNPDKDTGKTVEEVVEKTPVEEPKKEPVKEKPAEEEPPPPAPSLDIFDTSF